MFFLQRFFNKKNFFFLRNLITSFSDQIYLVLILILSKISARLVDYLTKLKIFYKSIFVLLFNVCSFSEVAFTLNQQSIFLQHLFLIKIIEWKNFFHKNMIESKISFKELVFLESEETISIYDPLVKSLA